MKIENPSQLLSAFFGLTSKEASKYKVKVYNHIHEIVFHGKGGYSWLDVYNMPLWLRTFTFNKIKEYYEEENKQLKEAQQGKGKNTKSLVGPDGKVKPSAFKSIPKKASYK